MQAKKGPSTKQNIFTLYCKNFEEKKYLTFETLVKSQNSHIYQKIHYFRNKWYITNYNVNMTVASISQK